MATVIDSLVVLLGLDASNYKKGRETAEKETSETARKAQIGADAITKSLTEVGRTIAGLFLGFESATGLTKWLGGLNAGEAALGRTAANIDMSAHELNKWGNAVELAGGSAQDAQAAFTQLTQDFQKMNATGEQSALLQFLRARSVNIRDANGNLRDQGEILEELADKTAQYGRAYQATMFAQVGLSQGEINYLTQSSELRQQQLALSERNNAVNDESVRKAQELQLYWRNVMQHIAAAGQLILTAVTPAMEQLLKVFGEVNTQGDEFATGLKLIGSAAIIIKNLFAGIGDTLGGAAAAVGAALHGDFRGALNILKDQSANSNARNGKEAANLNDLWEQRQAAAANAVIQQSAGGDRGVTYRNHNPGNLRPYQAGQATDSRGFRTFGTDAEGKAALEADLRAKMSEGLKTISAIISKYAPPSENDTSGYISEVSRQLRKGAGETLTDADIKLLAQAITTHEGAQVRTAAAGATHTTTVSVDSIHVSSPSADPRAVADQIPAAIKRKYSVSQADSGQS